ncbi:hypothetical protein [Mycobacterium sp. AZCC_0083]|uniref:hypothetical protein n=1 Tax=Mycobacterium sp. AZCC_0083 TaxID=2735882 RepID=UPI001608D6B7|nr:hypothetical protein [Mycobacterium sp. AZCC_0083]MBB5162485.1 hypothetical protein [Mycobacterium sp. AZCC_0083]
MTQPAEAPTTVDNIADQTSQDVDATDTQQATDAEPTPNSEAARYRVQLREAQTERDALAERLTGYQRRECESVVADLLDVPGDLWEVARADVAAFYAEDGTVNEAELRAAAGALIEQRPRLAAPGRPRPEWGQHGGTPPGEHKAGWGDVIGR